MIKSKILILLFMFIACRTSSGQSLNVPQSESTPTAIDISSSQATGYEFLGMGTASIIYSGVGINQTKLPKVGYAGGGALAITGAMFLIFGDKETGIKYWKGYDGIRPDYPYHRNEINVQKSLFITESGIIKYYKELKHINN